MIFNKSNLFFNFIRKATILEFGVVLFQTLYFVYTTNKISLEERGEYAVFLSFIGFMTLFSSFFYGSLDISSKNLTTDLILSQLKKLTVIFFFITLTFLFFSNEFTSLNSYYLLLFLTLNALLISLNALINLFLFKSNKFYFLNFVAMSLLILWTLCIYVLSRAGFNIIKCMYVLFTINNIILLVLVYKKLNIKNNADYNKQINFKANFNIIIQDTITFSYLRYSPYIMHFFINSAQVAILRICFVFVELFLSFSRVIIPFQRSLIINKTITSKSIKAIHLINIGYVIILSITIYCFKNNIILLLFGERYSYVISIIDYVIIFSIVCSINVIYINYINIKYTYPKKITYYLVIILPSLLVFIITKDIKLYFIFLALLSTILLILMRKSKYK